MEPTWITVAVFSFTASTVGYAFGQRMAWRMYEGFYNRLIELLEKGTEDDNACPNERGAGCQNQE